MFDKEHLEKIYKWAEMKRLKYLAATSLFFGVGSGIVGHAGKRISNYFFFERLENIGITTALVGSFLLYAHLKWSRKRTEIATERLQWEQNLDKYR